MTLQVCEINAVLKAQVMQPISHQDVISFYATNEGIVNYVCELAPRLRKEKMRKKMLLVDLF